LSAWSLWSCHLHALSAKPHNGFHQNLVLEVYTESCLTNFTLVYIVITVIYHLFGNLFCYFWPLFACGTDTIFMWIVIYWCVMWQVSLCLGYLCIYYLILGPYIIVNSSLSSMDLLYLHGSLLLFCMFFNLCIWNLSLMSLFVKLFSTYFFAYVIIISRHNGPLAWGLGKELTTTHCKSQLLTKCYTGPQNWQALVYMVMYLQVP
jgi:hypothetical protein